MCLNNKNGKGSIFSFLFVGNIFKDKIDGWGYIFIYIVLPVAQILGYMCTVTIDMFLLMLITEFGILYDCYTRKSPSMIPEEFKKLKTIFIFALATTIIAIILIAFTLCGYTSGWWYWALLPFLGQFTIGLRDVFAL